jgi:hypothetical protein
MKREPSSDKFFIGRVSGKIGELKEYGGYSIFLKGFLRYFLYRFFAAEISFS